MFGAWVVLREVICVKSGSLLVDDGILLLVASVPYPVISGVNGFRSSEGDISLSNSLCSCVVAVNWCGLTLRVSEGFEYCEWEASCLTIDE